MSRTKSIYPVINDLKDWLWAEYADCNWPKAERISRVLLRKKQRLEGYNVQEDREYAARTLRNYKSVSGSAASLGAK